MISSMTRKSAVSRSISTRAYFAAPGCFLYADSSASSSAIMSFSGSMPFSRASAFMASRISRDMPLLLDEVGTTNVAVWDCDDTLLGGDRDLLVRCADELAGDAWVRAIRGRRTAGGGAHTRAPADEPAGVVGLRQRPLRAR